MATKEEMQVIRETHQALLGVKGTGDKGLVGDFQEFKKEVITRLDKQNGRITKNKLMIVGLISLLTGLGILDATVLHKVFGG